jgi:hypothetical protein
MYYQKVIIKLYIYNGEPVLEKKTGPPSPHYPLLFPSPTFLVFSFFFFFFFWTSPVAPAIPLLMLHCLRPPSTMLRRSSPPLNRLGFRYNFSNLYLVFSTGFAQSHVGTSCSPALKLPIRAKQLYLVHHTLATSLTSVVVAIY